MGKRGPKRREPGELPGRVLEILDDPGARLEILSGRTKVATMKPFLGDRTAAGILRALEIARASDPLARVTVSYRSGNLTRTLDAESGVELWAFYAPSGR